MENYKIIFSPTGGTQKVADILAKEISEQWNTLDLSGQITPRTLCADDICMVAVPSFGGRVPGVAVERLQQISGNGAKAILVCVYGNRAYEDTLTELQDVLTAAGFCCVAAVAAIAEHSIMHQYAAGRPDAEDVAELTAFARQIKAQLANPVNKPLDLPGSHDTYKEYKGSSFKPQTDEKCCACGFCAKSCPVGAIDPAAPSKTDEQKCISCMRCIAVCPRQARRLDPLMVSGAAAKMAPAFAGRKQNELFV